jgi:RNA polymerase sigma-70 factor (ECF subfamily)
MGEALESSFVVAVGDAYRIAPGALAQLSSALTEHLAAARADWPGVHVSGADFAVYLAERVPDDGAPAEALTAMRTSDLYLACACVLGARGAAEAIERAVIPAVIKAVARVDGSPDFLDDVVAQLRAKLLVSDGDQAPRIARYLGRGPLSAFAQVMALRLAQSIKRRTSREDPADALLELPLDADDPEHAQIKDELRDPFRRAFRETLAELSPRARNVLRLYFVEEVASESIARMYNVHRATVARWVAEGRDEVLAGVRKRLMKELQLGRASFDSFARNLAGQLDVSLAGFLE